MKLVTLSYQFWSEYLLYWVFVFDFFLSFNRRFDMNTQEKWCVVCAVVAGLIICTLLNNPSSFDNFIDHALSIPIEERR